MATPDTSPVSKTMTTSEVSYSSPSSSLSISEKTFSISTPGVTIQRHSYDYFSYDLQEVGDSRGDSFFIGTNETWVTDISKSSTVNPTNGKAPTIVDEYHLQTTIYDQYKEYHMYVSDPSDNENPGYYEVWSVDDPPYTTTTLTDHHTVQFF